ncbi:MAG TPA: mechanosensitive ion channel family protein, partial [Acetobacteraceae bacterium]|nr:mechanosensitive ion channel family protein [Acetobacteraceae bacterium]
LLYNAIRRLCERAQRLDRTVTLFLANGARYLALFITFSAVLSTFGVATTSFVAVLGALGIAVGLALQGTLSNLAAGIMLVLFRPFHIGDRVESGGVTGTVREINLFYSELDTDDNVRVIFPNGKLWGEIVRVPSRNDTERVELKFTRPMSDDIEIAVARVQELVKRDRRIRRVAQIGVDTVNEGNYVLVVRVWVTREEAAQVHFDLNRAVKEEFQRRTPQREEARAAD